MNRDKSLQSFQTQLVKRIALITLIFLSFTVVILPYILYKWNLSQISKQAQQEATLIYTGLTEAMIASSADQEKVRAAVDQFKALGDFNFRIVRGDFVMNQFGSREDEVLKDQVEEDILHEKRGPYSELKGGEYRFVFPFITDHRCQQCHLDVNDEPVDAGVTLGIAEIVLDVKQRWDEAEEFILLTIGFLLTVLVLFSFLIYRLFFNNVLTPIQSITDNIALMETEDFTLELPAPSTHEINVLVEQVQKAAAYIEKQREQKERELEEERKKLEQVRAFALKKTDALGITDEDEISKIIERLSTSVEEVEKYHILSKIFEFVSHERKELCLQNDPDIIRSAALYLSEPISEMSGDVQKGSVELVLEEAITNAIVHGNLEICSKLKEESFEAFEEQLQQRLTESPYADRKVTIHYEYNNNVVQITITDEGPGFDWQAFLEKLNDESFLPHGRGITIMRSFATSMEFNETGNQVILTFEL